MNAKTAGRLTRAADQAMEDRDDAIRQWYWGGLKPSLRAIETATGIPTSTLSRIVNRPTKASAK